VSYRSDGERLTRRRVDLQYRDNECLTTRVRVGSISHWTWCRRLQRADKNT